MSELKVIDLGNIRESIEKGESVYYEYYPKSEADKVIEEKDEIIDELKEHIDELQKATDSAWSKVNAIYDELRRQKYKRCLAMAKWCHSMWILLRDENETKKSVFYWRWWNIWYELAEKFKEGV